MRQRHRPRLVSRGCVVILLLLFVNLQLLLLVIRSTENEESIIHSSPKPKRRNFASTKSDVEMKSWQTMVWPFKERKEVKSRKDHSAEQEQSLAHRIVSMSVLKDFATYRLSSNQRDRLAFALMASGANGSSQILSRFTKIPSWIHLSQDQNNGIDMAQKGIQSNLDNEEGLEDDSSVPCLYSEQSGRNVFLVAAGTDNWERVLASSAKSRSSKIHHFVSGEKRCPLPVAGQKGSSTETPEVSFIIPMHNHVDVTLECLLALLRQANELPSVEYVLVDDGSLEDVEKVRIFLQHMKESFSIRVKFHRQHRGIGYASIMTQATRLAEGRFLMLLNNDVIVMKGALRALYDAFEAHPNVGIAVPLFLQVDRRILDAGGIIFTDSSGWQYGRGVSEGDTAHSHNYKYTRDIDYATAACLLVSRSLFLELGMYDPRYAENKGAYYEDTDLSFHVRAAGKRVLFTSEARVLHYESISYGGVSKSNPTDLHVKAGAHAMQKDEGGMVLSPTGITGAKKGLMERGKAKFGDEWAKALTCHYLHKTVGSQHDAYIPATRVSTLRLLVAVDIAAADALLCGYGPAAAVRGLSGGGRAAPSVSAFEEVVGQRTKSAFIAATRLRTILETLHAAKVHLTLVFTGHDTAYAKLKQEQRQQGKAPDNLILTHPRCTCERQLRYLGFHIVPSLPHVEFQRKPTKKDCRFDAVFIAGLEPYKRLLLELREKCPKAPIVFDLVGSGDGSEEFRRLHTSPFLSEIGYVQLRSKSSSAKFDVLERLLQEIDASSTTSLSNVLSSGSGSIIVGGEGVAGGDKSIDHATLGLTKRWRLEEEHYNKLNQEGLVLGKRNNGRRLQHEQQKHSGSIFSAAVEAEIQFMLNSAVILLPSDRALRCSRMTVISAAKEAYKSGEYADIISKSTVMIPRPVPLRPTAYGVVSALSATSLLHDVPPLSFASRSGLIFVGDLYSRRDIDSLLWFIDSVLPKFGSGVEQTADHRLNSSSDEYRERVSSISWRSGVDTLRVVQLDGRRLPQDSMLPVRLLDVSVRAEMASNASSEPLDVEIGQGKRVLLYDLSSAGMIYAQREAKSSNLKAKNKLLRDKYTNRDTSAVSVGMHILKTTATIMKSILFLALAAGHSLAVGEPIGWDWASDVVDLYQKYVTSTAPTYTRNHHEEHEASSSLSDREKSYEEKLAFFQLEEERLGGRTLDGDVRRAHVLDALFQQSRVAVTPLRSTEENVAFHQIMSAMSRGVPVVSTTAAAVALPGFGDILGSIPAYSKKSDTAAPVLLLADDAHDFARKISVLYTDAAMWTSVVQTSLEFLEAEVSTSAVVRGTTTLLASIIASRPTAMAEAEIHHTKEKGDVVPDGGNGFSAFSEQISFARKSLEMQEPCSDEHTKDLLTFIS